MPIGRACRCRPRAAWTRAAAAAGLLCLASLAGIAAQTIAPGSLAVLHTVDERFQGYNVEMVEVTGGRFWAPYRTGTDAGAQPPSAASPAGLDPRLFRQRAPLDLADPRLRTLAAALGPSYVRVSGTWANSTYFHDADTPPPATPPKGFGGILTRDQWKGVIDFARAADARIVTSFAVSEGVRDAAGVWTPDQAARLLAFTKAHGGAIAAAELFNEPSFAAIGGAPKAYDAAAYARDFAAFRRFAKQAAPSMLIAGPGSVAESGAMGPISMPILKSADLLAATGRGVDVFSYHFYGTASQRCRGQHTREAALSAEWLMRTERERAFYAELRDRFEPGVPMWLTETGEAACGGNPWAASFADTFRYLHQLGWLAKKGVQAVMHNTLAASDYAIVDEETMTPRPSYWAAVLWRRLMGTTVLEAGAPATPDLYVYAHCLRGRPGGVALLAINADRAAARTLTVNSPSERFTIAAPDLFGTAATLNGAPLALAANHTLPPLAGRSIPAGDVSLAPATITFLAIPGAGHAGCR